MSDPRDSLIIQVELDISSLQEESKDTSENDDTQDG